MVKFIGLLLIALCLAAGVDLSSKPPTPSASWCAGFDEASLVQQLHLRMWIGVRSWECQDLFVVRVARTADMTLVQVPFTGGLWFRA
jgi:hypothetical protein